MGGVDNVQANSMPKEPLLLLYAQAKSQAPVRVSVPVIAVVGHPVLQAVFGGIGVLGPAANCSVDGSSRCPQHGWYAGWNGSCGEALLQSICTVLMALNCTWSCRKPLGIR